MCDGGGGGSLEFPGVPWSSPEFLGISAKLLEFPREVPGDLEEGHWRRISGEPIDFTDSMPAERCWSWIRSHTGSGAA